MKKLSLSQQHLDRIIIMGKKLYPKYAGKHNHGEYEFNNLCWHLDSNPNIDPILTIYHDSGTQWIHWLEFCMGWIIPKLKDCCGHDLKKFMQNFVSNYYTEARCVHPVDWLYEIFLKQS